MKTLAVIASFDEQKTIEEVVKKTLNEDEVEKVLVVDDGSTDRTARLAKKAGAEVVSFKKNQGKGMANFGLSQLTPALAFVIGYAGGDFLENIYKTIIKKPSLYSFPENLVKK